MRTIAGLAVCLALSMLPGMVGSQFMPGDWYAALRKPAFNPPPWVFAPVWTLLYLAMGTAAWLVWRAAGLRRARTAMCLFAAQLALNGAWTWLFFGLHRPDLAFADIALLWMLIAATAAAFARHSRPAAWLFAPYLAWVTFAAALNLSLWMLNRR